MAVNVPEYSDKKPLGGKTTAAVHHTSLFECDLAQLLCMRIAGTPNEMRT